MEDQATQEKIQQLQMMEQRLQNFVSQKQNFQAQISEIENALGEVEKSKEQFMILGGVMVSFTKEDIKKDLNSKKELAELMIKNLEKQETRIKEDSSKLQEEVLKTLKIKKGVQDGNK